MTLTELRFVVTLAEEQHFGRAAARCHVSQPTLSIAIKKLEDELGTALFERTKGRLLTTRLGEQVISHARVALAQTLAIKDLAASHKSQLANPLALGTLSSVGPYWLPQAITQLRTSAPQMPLLLDEDQPAALTKKLRSGELDVLLLTQSLIEPEVVCQILCQEDFVVLLPHQHPLAAATHIEPEQLRATELLLPKDGLDLPADWLAQYPQINLARRTGSSLEMLRLMVASNLGLTLVPRCAAQIPSQQGLVFRPLRAPAPYRILFLAWRSSFPRHKAIDALRQALQFSSAAYWDFTTERQSDAPLRLVDNRDW